MQHAHRRVTKTHVPLNVTLLTCNVVSVRAIVSFQKQISGFISRFLEALVGSNAPGPAQKPECEKTRTLAVSFPFGSSKHERCSTHHLRMPLNVSNAGPPRLNLQQRNHWSTCAFLVLDGPCAAPALKDGPMSRAPNVA